MIGTGCTLYMTVVRCWKKLRVSSMSLALAAIAASTAAFAKIYGDYCDASSALRRIRAAPCVRVSDLRAILDDSNDDRTDDGFNDVDSDCASEIIELSGWGGGKLVVLRARLICKPMLMSVDSETAINGIEDYCNHLLPSSTESLHDNRSILDNSCRASVELVPFALVDDNQYVYVNVEKPRPPPIKMGRQHIHPVEVPPYPFITSVRGCEYLLQRSNKDGYFQIEKEITAIGICRNRDGYLEIDSCSTLPYFVSNMTKEEIDADLSSSAKSYFWGSIMCGALAIGVFGCALLRFGGEKSWSYLA